MSETLHHHFAITTSIKKGQAELLPVQRHYPKDAVGIENAQKEVMTLLNMTSEDETKLVVVVYGFGGIGKTTLASSVVAMLNLDNYNYARVQLDEEQNKNNLKEMQKLILKDAFPCYHSGATIKLRDCQDGRDRLREAFFSAGKKPIFLHIDNALRSEDLKELLPEDLSDLPKRSRILLTTRKLDATDFFLNSGLTRRPFAVKTLEDTYAIEILCKDAVDRERIEDDTERILHICGGVPLALRIVGGHLAKMEYNADKCTQILRALKKGDHVKEENLSKRLIDFVYSELEDGTKDAFLDICCFFNGWLRRDVEHIVGAQEVKSLEEAALVTPFVDDKNVETIYAGEER